MPAGRDAAFNFLENKDFNTMATVKELKATARPQSGKGAARAERRAGECPEDLRQQPAPVTISVDDKELRQRILAGRFLTTIYDIDLEGKKHRATPAHSVPAAITSEGTPSARGAADAARSKWERRQFREPADDAELGVRNLQLALRRLRRFARQGAAEEFDLDGTIDATARDAGLLNIKMRPERHNAVKVLLLLDIGGSMDDHINLCEQLFTAARGEFKRLTHYYFHNCVYERLWNRNRQYDSDHISTAELLRTHPPDTKLIFVGDAAMAPHEILQPGGSIEHYNEEAGSVWLRRLANKFPKLAWLNPMPQRTWHHTASNRLIAELIDQRMYELTPRGIDQAVRALLR